jgi:phosphatidylserine decarboxylase
MNTAIKNQIIIYLFKILPTAYFSRIFGYITRLNLPADFLRKIISWYSEKFGVNNDEYTEPESGFKNLDDFFTRSLIPGKRKFDTSGKKILSPVDARVDSYGIISNDKLIQAKGIEYTISDLLPSSLAGRFIDGSFATLYLAPGDYHRIHSPVNGNIIAWLHTPGRLFTVQEFMVKGLPGLFSINERLTSFIETEKGMVAVCKVGAMNVGRISLSYDKVITNKKFFRKRKEMIYDSKSQIKINAGDELGKFHLGSTIVLLIEKNAGTFNNIQNGLKVKTGEIIGEIYKL